MVRSDFNIRVALARRESEFNSDLLTDWGFIVSFSKPLASMVDAELSIQMFYFLSDVES